MSENLSIGFVNLLLQTIKAELEEEEIEVMKDGSDGHILTDHGFPGQKENWIQQQYSEVYHCPHGFREVVHIDRHIFDELVHILETEGKLKATDKICTGLKVMFFLLIMQGTSYRVLSRAWQISQSNISEMVVDVNWAVIKSIRMFTRTVEDSDPDPPEIANNPLLTAFEGCMGAVACVYIPGTLDRGLVASLGRKACAVFKDKKGNTAQRVHLAVDFSGALLHLLPDWRVVGPGEALSQLPECGGKYYLGDEHLDFPLRSSCVTPFPNTPRLRKDQEPRNAQELFNSRHHSAYSIAKRVVKSARRRFGLLECMHVRASHLTFAAQMSLTTCAFLLNSFLIMKEGLPESMDGDDEEDVDDDGDDEIENRNGNVVALSKKAGKIAKTNTEEHEGTEICNLCLRDEIAFTMWQQYVKQRSSTSGTQ